MLTKLALLGIKYPLNKAPSTTSFLLVYFHDETERWPFPTSSLLGRLYAVVWKPGNNVFTQCCWTAFHQTRILAFLGLHYIATKAWRNIMIVPATKITTKVFVVDNTLRASGINSKQATKHMAPAANPNPNGTIALK